jgi:hypothetical protein
VTPTDGRIEGCIFQGTANQTIGIDAQATGGGVGIQITANTFSNLTTSIGHTSWFSASSTSTAWGNKATNGTPEPVPTWGSIGLPTITLQEQTAPSGLADAGRLFVVDNGSGKSVLKVQFGSGAAQVIATEP